MTRKRRSPQRKRVGLTIPIDNPALREGKVEYSDPATWSETWHVLVIAGAGAVCGWLIASGIAWVFGLAGNALQMFTAGCVGLAALIVCQSQTANARRVRQWATFDRQPGDTVKAPEFVPVADGPRTLVRDTELRGKVVQWAQLLPAANYSLAYRRWVEKERVFTRTEFEKVRGMMASTGLMKGNEITDAGRAAVGRWAVGGVSADEIHALRGEG